MHGKQFLQAVLPLHQPAREVIFDRIPAVDRYIAHIAGADVGYFVAAPIIFHFRIDIPGSFGGIIPLLSSQLCCRLEGKLRRNWRRFL